MPAHSERLSTALRRPMALRSFQVLPASTLKPTKAGKQCRIADVPVEACAEARRVLAGELVDPQTREVQKTAHAKLTVQRYHPAQ
jgi:hypothetical protein